MSIARSWSDFGMLAQSQLKSPDGQPRAKPRTRLGGARSDLT